MKNKKLKYALVALGLTAVLASCQTVDANEQALKITRGKVKSCMGPGWDGPHPFSFGYKVAKFSMGLQHTDMLADANAGDLKQSDAIRINAKGGAGFDQDVTINYRIVNSCQAITALYSAGVKSDKAVKETIIRPAVRSGVKDVAGNYTVTEIISTKRGEIRDAIQKELSKKMKFPPARGAIEIESVELRSSILPAAIQAQVDASTQQEAAAQQADIARRKAETVAETERLVAQKNNEKAIAQAEANQKVAEINAAAAATQTIEAAKAKAEANRLEAQSLTPELIAKQVAIAQAEALGKAGVVVVGSGNSNSPAPNIVLDARK